MLSAGNGVEALDLFAGSGIDLVITDLRMPEMDAIALPPLRARGEDIAELVAHFIAKHGYSTKSTLLAPGSLARLRAYPWPGNVRELENMVERALILSGGTTLDERHFLLSAPAEERDRPSLAAHSQPGLGPLNQTVEALEARMIDEALLQTGGNKAKAAALLDISERTLWYKLKKYRPDQDSF